jgi:hypothetical protein
MDDEAEACQLWYELDSDTASEDRAFALAGAWIGWTVDTSAALIGEVGQCDGIDEDVWGGPITDFVDAYEWGTGLGTLDSGLSEIFESHYPSEWKTWEDQVVGGYLATDITGVSDVYNINYGFGYEISEDGEVTVDSSGNMEALNAALEEEAVDGFYLFSPGYGFSF